MIMIGEDKDLSDLRDIQKEGLQKLIDSLHVGNDQQDLREKIKELGKQVGTAGDARQKLLKSAIRIIMENIVPDRMRIMFSILEQGPCWTLEEYGKLFECKASQAESLLKTPRYNEYDRMHFEWGVKASILPAVKVLNENSAALFQKFKKAVKSLVRARNRILQLQCEFKHWDNPFDYGLTPENVI